MRAKVLEVLWELAHLPTLPTSLVQQALEEHLGILSDAYAVKETVKRSYIIKCIEDIKKVRQTCYSIVFLRVSARVNCGSVVSLGHCALSGCIYRLFIQTALTEGNSSVCLLHFLFLL